MYQEGKFGTRIQEYLEKWRHRFDLFSPDAPFYQTAGLRVINGSGKPLPQGIASIALERASGHNKTLFDHTTTEVPVRLSPGEAAQTLVTTQMFSLRGLNKKATNLFNYQQSYLNAAMVSGIYIMLSGESLFETLMLNLLVYKDNEPIPRTAPDCPVWERTDIGGTSASTPKGYLDFLTCKCRHVLLVPQKQSEDVFVEHIHMHKLRHSLGSTTLRLSTKERKTVLGIIHNSTQIAWFGAIVVRFLLLMRR
jgi:CRISPR system Cascade subunit CasA